MNSPLRLIRDLLPELLPFAPPAERQLAGKLRARLEGLAELAPAEAVAALGNDVLPGIAGQDDAKLRFKLLEDIRPHAERTLQLLEAEVAHAALPLPKGVARSALLADNLIKGLATAYHSVTRDLDKAQDDEQAQVFHRAVLRAMNMLARRQQLAYRAYAAPSPTSWSLLHELYRMACSPTSKPLNGDTAPVEYQYLSALLFAFLEPNKLPRSELDVVIKCTQQLAAYAVIAEYRPDDSSGQPADACFLVRPGEGCPGLPLRRLPAGLIALGALLVDCTPVVAALDRNLGRQPGKAVQPDLDLPVALLQTLRQALDGKSARRFSRTRFRPRGDLVGGLTAVIDFIGGKAQSRRAMDAVGRDDGHFAPSEWSLIDESPDGFCVRFIKGDHWTAGAGDIVALQPRESSKIHVCLIRRIANGGSRLELGLQMLSPQVSVVDIERPNGTSQRAIFLHSLPAYGKFSGLITAPGGLGGGQTITLKSGGRSLQRKIGKCIEANDGLEFFALDPLPN
jgi:hypothetical protein